MDPGFNSVGRAAASQICGFAQGVRRSTSRGEGRATRLMRTILRAAAEWVQTRDF